MAGNKMGEQTKEKILQAAQIEFLENGFEKTRVEDIAKRAGVTKVMLYYHFSTKQNIFNEIIKNVVAEVRQAFEASQSRLDLRSPEDFRAHLKAMIAFYQERQNLLRLVVSEQIRHRDDGSESLAVFNDVFKQILDLPGLDPKTDQEAFLIRVFFFNALPMLMYACLSEQFCSDFEIAPEKCLDVFTSVFTGSFLNQASTAN